MLIAPLGSMACIGQRFAHSWQGLPHSLRRFNTVNRRRRSRPPIAIAAPSAQRNRQNARSTNNPAARITNAYATNGQPRSIPTEMTGLDGPTPAPPPIASIPATQSPPTPPADNASPDPSGKPARHDASDAPRRGGGRPPGNSLAMRGPSRHRKNVDDGELGPRDPAYPHQPEEQKANAQRLIETRVARQPVHRDEQHGEHQ